MVLHGKIRPTQLELGFGNILIKLLLTRNSYDREEVKIGDKKIWIKFIHIHNYKYFLFLYANCPIKNCRVDKIGIFYDIPGEGYKYKVHHTKHLAKEANLNKLADISTIGFKMEVISFVILAFEQTRFYKYKWYSYSISDDFFWRKKSKSPLRNNVC